MDSKYVVSQLTLEEKASLCSGKNVWQTKNIDRLGIPSVMMSDGPHGLRKQLDNSDNLGINDSIHSTCFPTAVTTACSFDVELVEQMGEAIAKECLAEGVDILLGPGINIKRSPLCGRNFEYFSEDPYLAGELGAAFVRGVQRLGVGTSVKHFAVNNQESHRLTVSAVVDERALREIYLAPFERVIQEKPATVMCSYNKINGVYASENEKLLNHILRQEWGYQGVVVTDWGACNDRVLGLKNGQDLEMPSSFGMNDQLIVEAVKNGSLKEEVLDQTVERILELVDYCQKKEPFSFDKNENHKLARKIANESMVLLKNDDQILPINPNKKIGIIGEFAKKPRYQGTGSSKINPIQVENVVDVLLQEQIDFKYADQLTEAVEVAKEVDVAIVFIGLTDVYESEGFDRTHMRIPDAHNEMVLAVTQVNPNVVIVLAGGSPVEMPWISQVKGLLNSYLGGESGALAVVDLLFGRVNPSGKLAESYPLKLEDNPSYHNFPGGNVSVYYKESIYVGYRFYEKAKCRVLFPFGYGLSYTEFAYNRLFVNKQELNDEDYSLEVKCSIKNTGPYQGSESVQLYVRQVDSKVFKPEKELKGFKKVHLAVGEEKEVCFDLNKRSFAYYNTELKDWQVESGEYQILIGSSSQDIRLVATIKVTSNEVTLPTRVNKYQSITDNNFLDNDFEALLGSKLPPLSEVKKRPFDRNSTIEEISHTMVGKILLFYGNRVIQKKVNDEASKLMMKKSLLEMPLRAVINSSGGMFTKNKVDGLLLMINGSYLQGLWKMIKK